MPRYDYRCTSCDETFTTWRSMSELDEIVRCDAGHEAKRLLSVFATVGSASPAPTGFPSSGAGCCGGGCGCH